MCLIDSFGLGSGKRLWAEVFQVKLFVFSVLFQETRDVSVSHQGDTKCSQPSVFVSFASGFDQPWTFFHRKYFLKYKLYSNTTPFYIRG